MFLFYFFIPDHFISFLLGHCLLDDMRVVNASFLLTKLPEHTWGVPGVDDNVNWTNVNFYKANSG